MPLGLQQHNVRPAEDGVRLLEPPLGLLGVKGKQLHGHMRPGCENGRVSSGVGGGIHKGANMCSRELRSKTANRGEEGDRGKAVAAATRSSSASGRSWLVNTITTCSEWVTN